MLNLVSIQEADTWWTSGSRVSPGGMINTGWKALATFVGFAPVACGYTY